MKHMLVGVNTSLELAASQQDRLKFPMNVLALGDLCLIDMTLYIEWSKAPMCLVEGSKLRVPWLLIRMFMGSWAVMARKFC